MNKRIFNESEKKRYRSLSEKHAPSSSLARDCVFAFIFGGGICLMGQLVRDTALSLGISSENVTALVPCVLIFAACLVTGLGFYDNIASVAKAGTLVPITGFANAVCSCAIDAKSEGFIFGVGAKLFTVSGPVIVYGTVASVLYGIIYYIIGVI